PVGRGDDVNRLADRRVGRSNALGLGSGARNLLFRGSRRRFRGDRRRVGDSTAVGRDLSQQRTYGNRVAFGGVDLDDRARGGRRNLGVDLVGRDLDKRLVGLNGVAFSLVLFEHCALGNRVVYRGHDDLNDAGNACHLPSTVTTDPGSAYVQ